MSSLERKTAEGMALLLLNSVSVRRLQDFITNYRWDHDGMLGAYQEALASVIAGPEDEGMLNVDSSEFVKKGRESVGVGRQYCGNLGKVENCQSGVFVGCAGEGVYGLVDCRLYLPKGWLTEEYTQRGLFQARWLGCDCTFGSDRAFLDEVGRQCWYFVNVRSNPLVWVNQPRMRVPRYRGRGKRPTKPQVVSSGTAMVAEIARDLQVPWRWVKLAEGAKGPVMAGVARLRDRFYKGPTPTLPQAQLLVAAVLEEGRVTKSRAIEIVRYYTKRNHVAWEPHHKARHEEGVEKTMDQLLEDRPN